MCTEQIRIYKCIFLPNKQLVSSHSNSSKEPRRQRSSYECRFRDSCSTTDILSSEMHLGSVDVLSVNPSSPDECLFLCALAPRQSWKKKIPGYTRYSKCQVCTLLNCSKDESSTFTTTTHDDSTRNAGFHDEISQALLDSPPDRLCPPVADSLLARIPGL